MPTLSYDCPRCSAAKITFDTEGSNYLNNDYNSWVAHYEVPAVCRHCNRTTIFVLTLTNYQAREVYQSTKGWVSKNHLNDDFIVAGYVAIKDMGVIPAPDHVPDDIASIFKEGATCHSLQCFNAAGAMFRLALDMATKSLLPTDDHEGGPNRAQRTRLYDRLKWLFESNSLPRDLQELADCVREDGNDAAHDGTLAKADAEDLIDFSRILLERIYTEPARLQQARERREQRRA